MLPRITMEARLAADPELSFSQSGTPICRLRVVSADRKKQGDEWVDGDTLWMDVTCFKDLAEHTAESVQKGDLVLLVGKIRTEEWDDRNGGGKRSKVAMIADSVAPSLQFRTLPHGTGQQTSRRAANPVQQAYGADPAGRAGAAGADPWATPQTEEPPF